MKIISVILSISILFFSCGLSTEELTKEVRKSMELEYSKNENYDINIVSLVLIKESDSEYTGVLETEESLKTAPDNYVSGKYNVEVVTDGKNFTWKANVYNPSN